MATTWDVANSNASVTFTGGNLVATATLSTFSPGRSTVVIGNGVLKYYEILINAINPFFAEGIGVANSSFSTANNTAIGFDTNISNGWYPSTGQTVNNSAFGSTIQTAGAAATAGFAVNGHNKYWVSTDGATFNNDVIANQNPVGNVGGIDISLLGDVFPAFSISNQTVAASVTADFGATTFAYSSLFATLQGAGYSSFDTSDVLFAQAVM